MSIRNPAHIVSVLFFIKGKGKGKDIAVSMVWTAIVKHTLRRNSLPVERRDQLM